MSLKKAIRNARRMSNYGIGEPPPEPRLSPLEDPRLPQNRLFQRIRRECVIPMPEDSKPVTAGD